MFKAFFASPNLRYRRRAQLGVALLVGFVVLQNANAVLFNIWNGRFLEALAHATEHPESELWFDLGIFALIAIGDLVIGTTAGYCNALFSIWWRRSLTEHYVPRWKAHAQRIEGASQRIQEDPGRFADIVEALGLDFLRSVLAIFAFGPLLWSLGNNFTSGPLAWPGALIVLAAVISGAGIGLASLVGRQLPRLQTERQVVEASFRKQLVHAEEQRSLIEAGQGWQVLFDMVMENSNRLCRAYFGFAVWATGYDKVMMLVPYAACLHNLATGALEFGIAMQIVNAFGQVQSGFSVVLRNWTRVADLQSVYTRLREFEDAVSRPPEQDVVVPHPVYAKVTA